MAVVHLEEPKFRGFVAGTNAPLIGGKVYVYDAGTSDLATIYTSQDAGTEHTNPVILDANGEAEIWYNSSVKVIVKDSDDVQQYSFDNIVANIEPSVSGVYNLVQNGSFETDTNGDGTPDNWTLNADTNGTIAIASGAGDSAHGNNGLLFTSGGSGGGSATTTPYQEVLAGEDIQVSFSLKSSAADNTCIVTVLWYQNNAGLAASVASSVVYTDSATNPTAWTYKSFSATAGSDTVYCKIKIEGVHSSGTVTAARNAHFDDIRVYQGPVLFPNVIAPVTSSSADLNACINFEETISATTSEVSIATGKTLNVVDGLGSLEFNGTALVASQADLDATTNFEETISATTSEVSVATGKTLNIVDDGLGLEFGGTALTATVAELNLLDGPNAASKALQLDSNAYVPLANLRVATDRTGVNTVSAVAGSSESADLSQTSFLSNIYGVSIAASGSVDNDITIVVSLEDGIYVPFELTAGTLPAFAATPTAGNIKFRVRNNRVTAQDIKYCITMYGTA